jgi:hypothetical protein
MILEEIYMEQFVVLVVVLGMFFAWLTHIITCLAVGMWGFLLAGAIFFPIGIIHGIMIWFGVGIH